MRRLVAPLQNVAFENAVKFVISRQIALINVKFKVEPQIHSSMHRDR